MRKTTPQSALFFREINALVPRWGGVNVGRNFTHIAFRVRNRVGARDHSFRGSMAGLPVPRPTLRRLPHGGQRTAWGRCDLLYLHRRGLAPRAPCQSPGALRKILDTTRSLAHVAISQRIV